MLGRFLTRFGSEGKADSRCRKPEPSWPVQYGEHIRTVLFNSVSGSVLFRRGQAASYLRTSRKPIDRAKQGTSRQEQARNEGEEKSKKIE